MDSATFRSVKASVGGGGLGQATGSGVTSPSHRKHFGTRSKYDSAQPNGNGSPKVGSDDEVDRYTDELRGRGTPSPPLTQVNSHVVGDKGKGKDNIWVLNRIAIVLFGDSLTEKGFQGLSWAGALAGQYARKADVINRGFGGYNTRWARLALKSVFPVTVGSASISPSLCVIWFGANDAALQKENPAQHVPINEYIENLEYIISFIRASCAAVSHRPASHGVKFILITPPPIDERQRLAYQAQKYGQRATGRLDRTLEVTGQYANACMNVGSKLNIPTLNLFKVLSDRAQHESMSGFFTDGLHLSEKGNAVMFEELSKLIHDRYQFFSADSLPWELPHWSDIDYEYPEKTFNHQRQSPTPVPTTPSLSFPPKEVPTTLGTGGIIFPKRSESTQRRDPSPGGPPKRATSPITVASRMTAARPTQTPPRDRKAAPPQRATSPIPRSAAPKKSPAPKSRAGYGASDLDSGPVPHHSPAPGLQFRQHHVTHASGVAASRTGSSSRPSTPSLNGDKDSLGPSSLYQSVTRSSQPPATSYTYSTAGTEATYYSTTPSLPEVTTPPNGRSSPGDSRSYIHYESYYAPQVTSANRTTLDDCTTPITSPIVRKSTASESVVSPIKPKEAPPSKAALPSSLRKPTPKTHTPVANRTKALSKNTPITGGDVSQCSHYKEFLQKMSSV